MSGLKGPAAVALSQAPAAPAAPAAPQQTAPGLYQPPDTRNSGPYPFEPLVPHPGKPIEATHSTKTMIQYEFYIPAAIWSHRAVLAFINNLEQITQGATIQKTATGVWEGEEEDTNIYRMILQLDEAVIDGVPAHLHYRRRLQDSIGQMLADLATWKESYQDAFMFTEKEIIVTFSRLVNVPQDVTKGVLALRNTKRKLKRKDIPAVKTANRPERPLR